MEKFDSIVIGLGVLGISTVRYLSKQEDKVMGVEKGSFPNPDATSYGNSRLFRFGYRDPEYYGSIIQKAMGDWINLQSKYHKKLFFKTGVNTLNYEFGDRTDTVIESCEYSKHPYSKKEVEEINGEIFDVPDSYKVVFQPDGGILDSMSCLQLLERDARENDALIQTHSTVKSWEIQDDKSVIVEIDDQEYHTDKLIFTTGAWTVQEFDIFDDYVQVNNHTYSHILHDYSDMEAFVLQTKDREIDLYGLTEPSRNAIKIGGLQEANKEYIGDLDKYSRGKKSTKISPERNVIRKYLNIQPDEIIRSSCLLTNTEDENPIIGKHPYYDNIYLGFGLSGHGFKIGNELGKILATISLGTETEHDIDLFDPQRFFN